MFSQVKDLRGETVRGRYEVKRLLGSGGFGAVYLARDLVLDIPVAVKSLFGNSPDLVSQFEFEARILARLKHRGLPRVSDYFPDKGTRFLVMDYIDGRDLQEVINGGVLPPKDEVVRWIIQVLEILEYIHKNDVVHRDVKPGNVKINGGGRAMLVDFGIAKAGSRMVTMPGAQGAFTPSMAPPEQCTSTGRTTPASDIYSTGATLYYALTGRFPADAVSRLTGANLVLPSSINPDVGFKLEEVIMKSMELNPTDRFRCAEEMAKALTKHLSRTSGSSVQGRVKPGPTGSKGIKIFRRDIRRK